MKRLMTFLALLAVQLSPVVRARAEETPDPQAGAKARYDLYSWKEGNDWDFSILPADPNRRADAEIRQKDSRLRGASKVKEKLLGMKEGDKISWQERADSGM